MSETTALYQHILNDDVTTGLAPVDIQTRRAETATIRGFLQQCERDRASMYLALVHREPRDI